MKANLYSIVLMAGAMISSVNAFAQPTTSAPTPPELAKNKVISIYSDAYASTGFEFGEWGSGSTYALEKIGDTDNVAKFTTTGLGYFGWQFGKVNTAAMDKLHVDVYGDAAFSVRVVPITGGAEVGQTIEVSAGKWTSVDLDTKVFADGGANLANVYQIKFDNVKSQTLYIDNVYFWSTSTDVDTEAPTQLTATLVESAFTTVTLSCTAVDNSGAVEFVVTDEAKSYSKTVGGVSGEATKVVLDGLTANTDYNFTVKALDAEGNECADVVTIAASTNVLPEPATKASLPASKVISIYCDDYTSACPFGIGGWGQSTTATFLQLTADDQAMYLDNFNYLGFELNNNKPAFDASDMLYLHLDVYPLTLTKLEVSPIWGAEKLVDCGELTAGKWNTIVLPLTSFDGIRLDNIYQIKFVARPEGTSKAFLDNIYFATDNDSSVASMTADKLTYADGMLRGAADARIVVCNVMGQMVANTEATEVSTAGWQPGLYIARQGNAVVKFVVK